MTDLALFLPSLDGGGAERVMVTLANAIAARGFAVDLVLATAQGPYLKDVSPTVRVVDLRAGRVVKSLLPLAGYLRRERPAAMLSAMNHANVMALLARKLARVPVRLLVCEHTTISVQQRHARGLAERINYALVPWLYPGADSICTVSRAASVALAEFARLPLERVVTLYNPFDLAHIEARASEHLDHPWLTPGQPPLVLAIGRLIAAKDFSTLIRAFAKLRDVRPARLLILGEGELRASLETLIAQCGLTSDEVQMPGFVANPYAYLARCAVFVLSSRREGLPGVLIEALACGAQVVSTDCPSGPDEILDGGRWGRLVRVGDVEALAEAMTSALETPRSALPNGRQRAADFGQERAVDDYLAALGLPLWAPAAVDAADASGAPR